jgi:hypothetical protein
MEDYTNKFGILTQDIARHNISVDFIVKHALIHNIGLNSPPSKNENAIPESKHFERYPNQSTPQ